MASATNKRGEEDFCVVVGIFFSNFVGSESGQIKSVKLLQNMVSNTTHHPPRI
jgi:hypothetical protein